MVQSIDLFLVRTTLFLTFMVMSSSFFLTFPLMGSTFFVTLLTQAINFISMLTILILMWCCESLLGFKKILGGQFWLFQVLGLYKLIYAVHSLGTICRVALIQSSLPKAWRSV